VDNLTDENLEVAEDVRRISINLPESLAEDFDRLVPWGTKGKVVESLIRRSCEDLAKEGTAILSDLIYGEFTIRYRRIVEPSSNFESETGSR